MPPLPNRSLGKVKVAEAVTSHHGAPPNSRRESKKSQKAPGASTSNVPPATAKRPAATKATASALDAWSLESLLAATPGILAPLAAAMLGQVADDELSAARQIGSRGKEALLQALAGVDIVSAMVDLVWPALEKLATPGQGHLSHVGC